MVVFRPVGAALMADILIRKSMLRHFNIWCLYGQGDPVSLRVKPVVSR